MLKVPKFQYVGNSYDVSGDASIEMCKLSVLLSKQRLVGKLPIPIYTYPISFTFYASISKKTMTHSSPPHPQSLFNTSRYEKPTPTTRIVNVAQVKHRSPLRYPGGKTWLVPRIRSWLVTKPKKPALFLEPFCGGAIVGLTVAFESLAEHVMLVELDSEVAAIWQTIINDDGGAEWLAQQIEQFPLSLQTLTTLFDTPPTCTRERAFQAILLNRTNHGGIMAKGAGRMKSGEKGKGITSRWYPQTIARRIRDIAAIRHRLTFMQGDALAILPEFASRQNIVTFIDPPYTAGGKRAGRRLYNHSELDHHALFQLTSRLSGDFLMTYDNAQAVKQLAAQHQFDSLPIAMKNTHHAKLTELLISHDLSWTR